MLRQSSTRTGDVDAGATQASPASVSKLTRTGGAEPAVQAKSSSNLSGGGGGGRMDDWQAGSLMGAMGLEGGVQMKGEGGDAGSAAIHQIADHGLSGAGGALPHQAAISQSFGPQHDVSGIKAHVGGAASEATSAMGAQAYAKGNEVAFGSSPSLHTAAHEAAHVIQQRAGVHLKGGVGEVGDPHERHADAVADAVVRGDSAAGLLSAYSGGGGGGGVQQQVVQMEATPLGTNTHQAANVGQGTQTDADGVATTAPTGSNQASTAANKKVKIVASEASKIKMPVGAKPDADKLFTESKAGIQVDHTQGTVDAPNTDPKMVEDCLFIAGAPQSSDVRQGGIGDCYFMAVLLGIINGDPGKLTSMMSSSAGSVTTDFFRFNQAQNKWVSNPITNTNTLQTRANGTLKGASFRIATDPKESFWYAKLDAGTLKVIREDKFECAMWGPMMEKNYADFAQQFGQYGKGLTPAETAAGASGYSMIDGGSSQECYNMFYGNSVTATGTTGVNFDPSSSTGIVMQNLPALTQLVQFQERMKEPGPAGGAQRFLQARMSPVGSVQRCQGLIQRVLDRAAANTTSWYSGVTDWMGMTNDAGNEASFRASGERALSDALATLKTAVDTYLASQTAANQQAVANAARPIQNPTAHPVMWGPTADRIYVELRENLGILINLGSDNGPGRRTLYAAHAYNIHGMSFQDRAGQPVAVTSANIATKATEIDGTRSTVTMENPHATNEWDEKGTGAPDGKDQGRFNLTLDQLLRNTDLLRTATVNHDPQIGDFPTPDPNGPQYA